jgi:hypothetical protein
MIDKAIYSLWTKPMDDFLVGFNSEEIFIKCLSISLEMSNKYFTHVELVTDIKGKELLIDKYGLPFTSVSIELEEALKGIDSKHWAIGKIYSCKIQKEPFIHIDNDVIWSKKPHIDLLSADACFQQSEIMKDVGLGHIRPYINLINNFRLDSKYINWDFKESYNCGIIGFNRLDLLDIWWDEALKYIEYIDNYNMEYEITSLIFEQFYITNLCNYFNYSVKLITDFSSINNIEHAASILGYTHFVSDSKKTKENELIIEKVYDHVINKRIT